MIFRLWSSILWTSALLFSKTSLYQKCWSNMTTKSLSRETHLLNRLTLTIPSGNKKLLITGLFLKRCTIISHSITLILWKFTQFKVINSTKLLGLLEDSSPSSFSDSVVLQNLSTTIEWNTFLEKISISSTCLKSKKLKGGLARTIKSQPSKPNLWIRLTTCLKDK